MQDSSVFVFIFFPYRGVEQLVARWAHNPKAVGSNPTPQPLGPHSCLLCGFPYFICVLQFSVNPPPFIIYAFCKPCWMIIHSDTACFFIPSRHFQEFDRYSDRYCQDSLIFCLLLTMPNIPYPALRLKRAIALFFVSSNEWPYIFSVVVF